MSPTTGAEGAGRDKPPEVWRPARADRGGGRAGALVGPPIRAARTARGWTQEELARQAGVGRSTISDIERGVDLWRDRDMVQRLVALLDLEGDPPQEPAPRPRRGLAMQGKP